MQLLGSSQRPLQQEHLCPMELRSNFIMVLIFCVEFWELSYLTRDLSQAEKKMLLQA